MKINRVEKLRQNVHGLAESLGNLFVETFDYLALGAMFWIYFKSKVKFTYILNVGLFLGRTPQDQFVTV
ncbi:hypothetical protein [Pseudomonas sp. 7-41]|uniref:hypothetical protein n=1 Tax=Pseudomonas sp. 7-41 TaxID=2898483 RepID=UPI003FA71BEB